jgi:hypothetical protein
MSLRVFFAGLAATLMALQACHATENNDTKDEEICRPGVFSLCLCEDSTYGTQKCKEDGKDFYACRYKTKDAECIQIPDDNGPVDGNGIQTDGGVTKLPPVERCPGKGQDLPVGTEVVIEGDSTDAKDDERGKAPCSAKGADHIYGLKALGTGKVTLELEGDGDSKPVAYVRKSCIDSETQLACGVADASGVAELTFDVSQNQYYFLVIDGIAGKYKAKLKLEGATTCGNGVIDKDEACDSKDGCTKNCTRVDGNPTSGQGCPGHPVHVWGAKTVVGEGSTTMYGNAFTKTASSCSVTDSDSNTAPEHVYEVTPHATGTLVAMVQPYDYMFDVQLVARRTCSVPASQGPGMCANANSGGTYPNSEEMRFAVTQDEKVWVAVDGVLGGNAGYRIEFRIE